MRGQVVRVLLAAALLLLVSASFAQSPILGGPGQPPVPVSLASPRATMKTYLDGMNDADIGQAESTLDLDRITPLERSELGPQIAFKLWAILNRQVYIQEADLSSSSTAEPFLLPITDQAGKPAGAVVIEKDSDNAYRFSEGTVQQLDSLWNAVKDKPVIRGLDDPSIETFAPSLYLEKQVPPESKELFLGMPLWKWIVLVFSLLFAAFGVLVIRVLTALIIRILLRLPKTKEATREIDHTGKALSIVILCSVGLRNYPFLGVSDLVAGWVGSSLRVGIIIGWVLVGFAVWDLSVRIYVRRVSERSHNAERLVAPVLSRLGKAGILVIATIFILSAVGINVTAFIATIGIGGLVIALAAKDSVENLFGSVMVLIERPFQIGDWIRIRDVSGEVEDIRLRSTRIRTFEDSLIILPNSALVTSNVENYGMRRHRRMKTTLEVVNDVSSDNLSVFTSRLRKLLLDHPHVWDEHAHVYVNDFGPSSRRVLFDCFLIAPTYQLELEYREAILVEIMQIAESMGVRFGLPATAIVVPAGEHPAIQ